VTKRTARRGERGQALAETGIVIVLFVMLVMGTIEFGRAWMISNMITHAARDGARMAATWPTRTAGAISSADKTTIQSQVQTEMANVMGSPTGLTATVSQTTAGTIPTVQVRVNGSVSYLFQLLPGMSSFAVDRTVTFRDEGN
jgi:Flp pilus assembly protein TadG